MRTLLVLVAVMGLGCGKPASDSGVTKVGHGWWTDVMTVEHDGHKFIVTRCPDGVSTLHHPSCACLKPY